MSKSDSKNDTESQQLNIPLKNDNCDTVTKWPDEQTLIQAKVINGSKVEEIIRSCYPQVFGLASRLSLGDAEATKDLVQESFYRALSKIDSFQGQSAFSTWMYRIVVNTWTSTQRRHKMLKTFTVPIRHLRSNGPENLDHGDLSEKDDSNEPEITCHRGQFKTAFQEALRSLPQKQQLVFTLKFQQDLNISEIAEITGLAVGTVKTHLYRATRKLQKKLKEWDDL